MTRLPNEQAAPEEFLLQEITGESCNYFRSTDFLPLGACLLNFAENSVLAVNDQIRKWIGEQNQTISMNQVLALLPDLNVAGLTSSEKILKDEKANFSKQTTLIRDAAPPIHALVHLNPMFSGPQTWHLLLIHPCEHVRQIAGYTDVVTGLPDRRALAVWCQRQQYINPSMLNPYALLFLDLDDFKQINDQHGHACGDRLLALLAERWHSSLRNDDLVVRYGGDEFVILLAGVHSIEEAAPVIQRLKSCTSAPLQIEHSSLSVSVSIGLALANDLDIPMEEVLAKADRDMYAQKGQA